MVRIILTVLFLHDKFIYSGCDRPSFDDLVDFVVPHAATKWYDLGLQIMNQKYKSRLAIIKEGGTNDDQVCCRKMLGDWLSADELPTWNKIIYGLKVVGMNYAANSIKMQLQG